MLTEALAAEWTREQAAVLERTEGAESVVDAVQRVASASPLVPLECLFHTAAHTFVHAADGSLIPD